MGFNVFVVTGPRRSGKSALLSSLIEEVCPERPHYIRLAAAGGTKRAPRPPRRPESDCGVVTARWIEYEPARVFETLPDTLDTLNREDEHACVVIEADTDPNLPHAYPWDLHLFVMPAPERIEDVFRSPQQSREALKSALHDTAVFANEVFGLSDDDMGADDAHEKRATMTRAELNTLLHSPLGRELASRLQCRPEYRGMLESDIIVVNCGIGGTSGAVDEAVYRMEQLVHRVCRARDQHPVIFSCDVCDPHDPRRQKLFEHLARHYASHGSKSR